MSSSSSHSPPYVLNLELIQLCWPLSPGIFLSLPPQHWDITGVHYSGQQFYFLMWMTRIQTQVLKHTWQLSHLSSTAALFLPLLPKRWSPDASTLQMGCSSGSTVKVAELSLSFSLLQYEWPLVNRTYLGNCSTS